MPASAATSLHYANTACPSSNTFAAPSTAAHSCLGQPKAPEQLPESGSSTLRGGSRMSRFTSMCGERSLSRAFMRRCSYEIGKRRNPCASTLERRIARTPSAGFPAQSLLAQGGDTATIATALIARQAPNWQLGMCQRQFMKAKRLERGGLVPSQRQRRRALPATGRRRSTS